MILHVHEEVLHESEAVYLVGRQSDGVFRLEACLRAGGFEQLECFNEPHFFGMPSVGRAEAVFELEAQVPNKGLCAHEEDRERSKRDRCAHLKSAVRGMCRIYGLLINRSDE